MSNGFFILPKFSPMPSQVSWVATLAADDRTWYCQGDVVGREEEKINPPDHHFPSSPADGSEMEMDACRVYEEPIAVRSPTKTCHTSGSACPLTWMKTGRCVFVRRDANSVPSRCVGRIARYLRIGVICHGRMAWLVGKPPGRFSQNKVGRQSCWT